MAAKGKGDERHHRANPAVFPGLSNVGGWQEGEFSAVMNSIREMGQCYWLRERAASDLASEVMTSVQVAIPGRQLVGAGASERRDVSVPCRHTPSGTRGCESPRTSTSRVR